MYLLDTNTLIYFFKGQGAVAERLLDTPPTDLAIPAVALFELEVGLGKSQEPYRRRSQLETLLQVVRVLPLGPREARSAGRIRVNLEAAGRPLGPFDTLIAGTALANDAIVVTRNLREFERVEGLRCVDWYEG